jgi:microcompartment protein CcmL/EutN
MHARGLFQDYLMSILGLCEWGNIASGMVATDAMVKRAPVELLETGPIDPGRYLTVITGDLACVEEAVAAGGEAGKTSLVRSVVLANLHPRVLDGIKGEGGTSEPDAVAIVETSDTVAAVESADAACKAAGVALPVLHLARHIGGKGYFVLCGDLPDVEAAGDAARGAAGRALVDAQVIPQPDDAFFARILQPARFRKV